MTSESHVDDPVMSPAERWRHNVAALTVPEEIRNASPEPDFTPLQPERFRWRPEEDAKQPVRPSRRRALEALPDGGTVLDVGVGGGASSLGLVPKVGLIIGVDSREAMLEAFEASAKEAGVATRTVLGMWPDVAAEVEAADVVVCHHAMYGAVDVEAFIEAMTAHARSRVVLELSARSPLAGLNPLWKAIHGLDRPDSRVADDAQAVLEYMGLAVQREDMVLAPRPHEVTPESVAFTRRRLCVGPDRDPEIEALLREHVPDEHRVVALWWPGAAPPA